VSGPASDDPLPWEPPTAGRSGNGGPPFPGRPRNPSHLLRWVAVGVGVVLLLGVPTAVGLPVQLIEHTTCVDGSVLAEGQFWTPIYLLDSAQNVTATAVGSVPFETAEHGVARGGESVGGFALDQWYLYSLTARTVPGPGAVSGCQGAVAVDASRTSAGPASTTTLREILLPEGASTDVGLASGFNASPSSGGTVEPSVLYALAYVPGCDCGVRTDIPLGYQMVLGFSAQGNSYFVRVPFTLTNGTPEEVPAWLPGSISSHYYLNGTFDGCVGWDGSAPNPYGTGLEFAPLPAGSEPCP